MENKQKRRSGGSTHFPHHKVIVSSVQSSSSEHRPMLLNAWTQTTEEDFEYSEYLCRTSALPSKQQSKTEDDLRAKVRLLEETLRTQTAKLNKLQTSENVAQSQQSLPSSVKYTIIAAEPIEVELAEENGTSFLSEQDMLNDSADSGRLQICLKEEMKNSEDASPIVSRRNTSSNGKRESNGHVSYEKNQQQNLNYQQENATTAEYRDQENYNQEMSNVLVSLGPNNTRIPAKAYENMNWSSGSIATRKLLTTIFDRQTLATHTMTGKPSPAFKEQGKPTKQMLNPDIISDIIFAVTRKCGVSEKEVKTAITTKCADENKMFKIQMAKRGSLREINKENIKADAKFRHSIV